jgi:hypothetical protein
MKSKGMGTRDEGLGITGEGLWGDGPEAPRRGTQFTSARLRVCEAEGCGRWVPAESRFCAKCTEEIDALNEMTRGPRGGRLENFAYISATVVVMVYLAWETRGFWIEWAQMIVSACGRP